MGQLLPARTLFQAGGGALPLIRGGATAIGATSRE